MCDEKAVVRRARRVGPVVELRYDPLDLNASRAERQGEVIVAVRTRAEEEPLECWRSPIAIERPEEQFAEPPPGVDVRLGGPARDDAVLLAVVVWIVLEPRVEIRVGDDGDRAEQRLDREPAGRRPVTRSGRPQRVAPRVTRAGRGHVAVHPRPG